MDRIDDNAVKNLMMTRQHFYQKADESEYEHLFRLMSPVPTKYWVVPGSPPIIEHRKSINDYLLNSTNRKNRTIIKGRFQGGNVGYIYADDLPLYRAVYIKEIKSFTEIDDLILNTIKNEGPMNIKLIKEITGLLAKQITPSLQKMQKAFILFEDQVDNEWDRAWYLLEDEFDDYNLLTFNRAEALKTIIRRFVYLNVWVDADMVKSFTKIKKRNIDDAIKALLDDNTLITAEMKKASGYILKQDEIDLKNPTCDIPDVLYILDLNDYLVKSHEFALKERFNKQPYKTLYYIMIKGEIIGAVFGRFRFGPDDLEDIALDLLKKEQGTNKARIIEAVEDIYDGEAKLKRYGGIDI